MATTVACPRSRSVPRYPLRRGEALPRQAAPTLRHGDDGCWPSRVHDGASGGQSVTVGVSFAPWRGAA